MIVFNHKLFYYYRGEPKSSLQKYYIFPKPYIYFLIIIDTHKLINYYRGLLAKRFPFTCIFVSIEPRLA